MNNCMTNISKSNRFRGKHMIATITIEPRFQETDLMGIVHHSVYPVWYELGRIQLCKDLGLPYETLVAKGIHMAIIHVDAYYHQSARFGDQLLLKTALIKMTNIKLTFAYTIEKEGQIIHKGSTTLVWLNDQLKPSNVAKSHPDVYQKFKDIVVEASS